jgi:adenosylcobinamide amidohydrolase
LTPELLLHTSTDRPRPVLVWRLPVPRLAVSSAPVGGGMGLRSWVLDAEVPLDYARHDLHAHVAGLAATHGCRGEGVGMLTAAAVERWREAIDGDVAVQATVGVTAPTWAAGPDDSHGAWAPGTVNVIAHLPVRLSPAALVNAVMTVTEAKTQALVEAGVPGTGTASDAVCVLCPPDGAAEAFAGPRSPWGARLARAVHAAVLSGLS